MLALALVAVLVAGLTAPVPAIGFMSPPTIDCSPDADSQACHLDVTADPACTRSPCPTVKGRIAVRNQGMSGDTEAGIGFTLGGLDAAPKGFAPQSACAADSEFVGWDEITCEFEHAGNAIKVTGRASFANAGLYFYEGKITVYVFAPTSGYGFTGCEKQDWVAVCSATLTGFPAQSGAKLVCGAIGGYRISVECEAH